MKKLQDILYRVAVEEVYGSTDVFINKPEFDSRKIVKDDLFIAQTGTQTDGHKYIASVVAAGAKAIICEKVPDTRQLGVTYIVVPDSKEALAVIADNFYDNPSSKMALVGVTGTNGKTTVATLLYKIFNEAGKKAGLLSTIKVGFGNREVAATHTTPDSLQINYYLSEMVKQDIAYCFMEVSSHGIHQKRSKGLHFAGGVFTNLTHDHLDYHGSFAEYRDIKKSFFDQLPKTAFALTNADDKNGKVMLQNTAAKKYTYALKTVADYKGRILENQLNGMLLSINEKEIWTKLLGVFNAYNVLAIYGVADLLGISPLENLQIISRLESVQGRFQYVISKKGIIAIIDYAHTPDALRNVLETINGIRTRNEKVITVVGCGGNRDKTKRPKMGHIATQLSDKVIFTSDNPRSEDPETIISEMEAGVEPQNVKKFISIANRKQAIKTAVNLSEKRDIILVAGKGHETYQEIKGVRKHFDDFEMVNEFLKVLQK
ncbi:MAG: UDP-N-acetylmuramoyl-L-alanyl-D-glutamate--2,6-diaminopimelate ligase [Flavobacteriales bacterium]|nr:MAG: UDP-N-acetylmuramoyl-L-alanyl-D-glutamate--2,6-diaminopimelate ligase [Flavobacteriales bacterium]